MRKFLQSNSEFFEKLFYFSFIAFIFIAAAGQLNLKDAGIPLSFGGNLQKIIIWPILFSIIPFINKRKQFSKYSVMIFLSALFIIVYTSIFEFCRLPSKEGLSYHLYFITGVFILYLSQFFNEKEKINKLMLYLSIGAAFCVLIGFLNTLLFDSKEIFLLNDSNTKRLITSFGHPNFLGGFLILVLPISLNLLHFTDMKFKYIVFIFINTVIISGVILSYSRTSWVAGILGITVFFILKFKIPFKKLSSFIFIIFIFYLFISYKLPDFDNNSIYKRILSFKNLKNDTNVIERIYAFHASLKIIKSNKLFGIGAGNLRFQNQFIKYRHPSSKLIMPHPHNMFLHIASSYGVIIFFIFVTIIFGALIRLLYVFIKYNDSFHLSLSVFSSILSVLIFGLFDSPIFSPRLIVLIMMMTGLSFSMNFERKGTNRI